MYVCQWSLMGKLLSGSTSTKASHRGWCWAPSCCSATSTTFLTQSPSRSNCLLTTACCTIPSNRKMTTLHCRKTLNLKSYMWGMKFNAIKMLYIYHQNVTCKTPYFYELNGTILQNVEYNISKPLPNWCHPNPTSHMEKP